MSNYFSDETIVAISTSVAGDGGVGIIRVSGTHALEIFKVVTKKKNIPKPRYFMRINFYSVYQDGRIDKDPLDDGLAVFFPENKSFTGEDVIEFHLHGGRVLLQSALKSILSTALCRIALPGEFSFRAVKNGRMSLSKASLIQKAIQSKNQFELSAVRKLLNDQRVKDFDQLRADLSQLIALLELSIDFIDQDVEVLSENDFNESLKKLLTSYNELIEKVDSTKKIASGIKVTLFGSPNAGKSTLFNNILSEDRAIVSDIAGTTRDVITENVMIGAYPLLLADTAGLRESEDFVERVGIEKAHSTIEHADFAIFVFDATDGVKAFSDKIEKILDKSDFFIFNKSDLLTEVQHKEWTEFLNAELFFDRKKALLFTAKKPELTKDLRDKLIANLNSKYGLGLNSFLPSEFQYQLLIRSRDAVLQAKDVFEKTKLNNPEILSAALFSAANALANLVGETTPDGILTKIFSEFCIGK